VCRRTRSRLRSPAACFITSRSPPSERRPFSSGGCCTQRNPDLGRVGHAEPRADARRVHAAARARRIRATPPRHPAGQLPDLIDARFADVNRQDSGARLGLLELWPGGHDGARRPVVSRPPPA
jgi:hypothetical protein